MTIPPPVIEKIGKFLVVRDDLLPGGTKRRLLDGLLSQRREEEFVYATPAYGYAQIALAHSCRAIGKRATIFVAKRAKPHKRTLEAKRAGARVIQVPHGYLNVVQKRARDYCESTGAALLPFGFDSEEFSDLLAQCAKTLPIKPTEVWTAAGSGTLSRSLQKAWPSARFFAVQVGRTPNVGRATLLKAPEKFEIDAKHPPPFPSCSNYDAKVWQFMTRRGSEGALFWNVGA